MANDIPMKKVNEIMDKMEQDEPTTIIHVTNTNGEKYTFENINLMKTTIEEFRKMVIEKIGKKYKEIRLISGGKMLIDGSKTLNEYGVSLLYDLDGNKLSRTILFVGIKSEEKPIKEVVMNENAGRPDDPAETTNEGINMMLNYGITGSVRTIKYMINIMIPSEQHFNLNRFEEDVIEVIQNHSSEQQERQITLPYEGIAGIPEVETRRTTEETMLDALNDQDRININRLMEIGNYEQNVVIKLYIKNSKNIETTAEELLFSQ